MIDGLSFALTLGCVVAAAVVGVRSARRRTRWSDTAAVLVSIQVGLVVQAVLDVAGLVGGHRPGELSTHVAYLVCSLVVVPIVAVQVRGDDVVWAAALVVAALLLVAVLVIRMQTTWRSA